jgi:hypothetical protein
VPEWLSTFLKKAMKSLVIALSVVCAVLIIACKKSGYVNTESPSTIQLHTCATTVFKNSTINLCFDSVLSDSRCPENVVCIQGGGVTCKFSFSINNQGSHPITLSTEWPGSKDTTLLGYKIELINLTPYPHIPQNPVPDNERKAEVKITEL